MSRILRAAVGFGLAAVAFIAAAPAEAQPQESDAPRAERRGQLLRVLAGQLGLDARQIAEIRAVREQAAAGRQAARSLPAGSPEAQRARHHLRERTLARVLQLLTPEQRVRLGQLRAEKRVRKLSERLGLNARQAGSVRSILQEAAVQRPSVRSLPPGSTEQRQARRALRERLRARLEAVLTPAQRETFERLREERRARRGGRRGRP